MKPLTPEEIRVLEGLCADKTSYAISIEEDVTHYCVSRRIQRAMKKLGVETRTGLAVAFDRMRPRDKDIKGVD